MRDSYFLYQSSEKAKPTFKQFGCCETLGSSLSGNIITELIVIDEIPEGPLRISETIERYIELISNFMEIPIKKTEFDTNNINGYPSSLDGKKVMMFTLCKHSSNKHIVAIHNLIRYLWYEEHNEIVNILLNLSKLDAKLEIQDMFAIAHSFSTTDGRALTGRPMDSSEGLIYFPNKEVYIKRLKEGTQFNTVFDSQGIVVVPAFKIRGTFFGDSELDINSKSALTGISRLDINAQEDSIFLPIKQAITMYLKNKPIYEKATVFLNRHPSKIFREFNIHCNNVNDDITVKIKLGTNTTGTHANLEFSSVEDLNNKLLDPKQ